MPYPTLPNGLTDEEYNVMTTILAHPQWTYVQVWRSVRPESKANNENASKAVQNTLKRPHVKAALEEWQRHQMEAVDRDIDEVDKGEYERATAKLTDVLTLEGDLLPPSQWPERAKSAVESYSVRMVGTLGKDGPPIIEKRVKMWNPTTSARLVYERRGLLVERKEVTGKDGGPIQVDARIEALLATLSDDDLRRLARGSGG